MEIISNETYSGFEKAYQKLKIGDKKEATQELWEALGINNRVSFLEYRKGKIIPKLDQAISISKVFEKYGIKNWNQ